MSQEEPFALSLSKGPSILSLSKDLSLSKGPSILSLSKDLSLSKGPNILSLSKGRVEVRERGFDKLSPNGSHQESP